MSWRVRNKKRSLWAKQETCFLLVAVLLFLSMRTSALAQSAAYTSVPNQKKQIALTFDDGPHPSQTHRILEILDRYDVQATFFMIGVNVEHYPDAAREVIARGHEVGNHTYTHSHLQSMGEYSLMREVGRCEDVLEGLCEYRPHLFRPPEGVINSHVEACAAKGDYRLILWSLDTKDWETKNAQMIASRVLNQIQSGDIVLMHDYVAKSKTPEALEIFLPKLLALGYEPVTVSALLGIG